MSRQMLDENQNWLSDPPELIDDLNASVKAINTPTLDALHPYDKAMVMLCSAVKVMARMSPRTLADERWQELRELAAQMEIEGRALVRGECRRCGEYGVVLGGICGTCADDLRGEPDREAVR